MYSLSVPRKPFSISSTVTIKEMASAMKMIASVPAPTRIMMTGPESNFRQGIQHHEIRLAHLGDEITPPQDHRERGAQNHAEQETDQRFIHGHTDMGGQAVLGHVGIGGENTGRLGQDKRVDPAEPGPPPPTGSEGRRECRSDKPESDGGGVFAFADTGFVQPKEQGAASDYSSALSSFHM